MTMATRKADFGTTQQPYKMSFTSGGLFLNESVIVAELHVAGEDWKVTLSRALEEGATSLPKAASNRRTLREIVNRLMTLTEDEVRFLVEDAGRQEQQHLLWVATCRAYRFVREFAVEVICDRYIAYQLDLPLESFDIFFDAKADWNEGLASISDSTRNKLRQILFRMMREAGVISDGHRIQSTYLSAQLRQVVEATNPADLAVFPGVVIDGGPS
ncbi:hypothetical protein ROE7235_03647 [Roseibaca ekhonensis]|uniref:Uncharacterized protein n=1 Tax=Roseinatronobacter ekhonensis TaxID=254356 RepID=A0A3B0MDI4_9RHOB|nr:DUF1819 family protein [Roseibaca ekhonensis]SUZ33872.1 hypothetical protein ROE7235_03647 [Roseibaca ekhonensis]